MQFVARGIESGATELLDLARTALASQDHIELGYPSWTAYLTDALGGAAKGVDRVLRRELVVQMHEMGMSTRAIAPIVGVDNATVHRDLERVANATPETGARVPDEAVTAPVETPQTPRAVTSLPPNVNPDTGEIDEGITVTEHTVTEKVKTVTGLDGKTYPQKPRTLKPVLAGDDLTRFDAEKNAKALGDCLRVLDALTYAEHRAHHLTVWWPDGKASVAPTARDLLTPTHLRDFATALLAFADELEAQP